MLETQIETPWGVNAYGAASVRATPDLVRVRLVVERTEPTPKEAFEAGQNTVTGLRRVLRSHDIPDAGVSGARLTMTSSWEGYGKERKFLGYTCEAAFTIESGDLDGLQRLLIDVVDAGVNRLEAVDFDVRAKAELRERARRSAVDAARAKAELYAEAAGVRLGRVVHIRDVDPDSRRVQSYRGHGASAEAAEEDLAPGNVVVSAAVVLGFALEES
ncbi:SIMPL domain-containing protein [Spongiactinospora sp. TRM90649]|uniref:SIMPL domain-containing protein n=1 Tax=Spongiactinospora sp. TRM90649 TaxID=3031114 RepID=UPI0023F7BD61|nr:SIMPL domain-containing protein [Spongiactinospora sp. TRM90649]MDF5751924.1 SIMPL domain-containing protein [Spongiactinospora sp. TRM90649]